MWLECSMMGDGVREITGARWRGSLVSDGQGFGSDSEGGHWRIRAEKGHDPMYI